MGEHYYGFGGRSPINDQNRALLAALRAELDRREIDTPVIWGNRNFTPFTTRRCARPHDQGLRAPGHRGHQRLLVLLVLPAVPRGPRGRGGDRWPRQGIDDRVDKVRPYCQPPGLLARQQPAGHRGRARGAARRGATRPAYGCCSSPTRSRRRWTRRPDPVTRRATPTAASTSRSGRPSPTRSTRPSTPTSRASSSSAPGPGRPTQPWLEPDVNDRLEELRGRGRRLGRRGAHRLRLRPHGGRLRPRHRGRRDGGASSGCAWSGCPPSASTRSSCPGWSTSSGAGGRGPRRAAGRAGLARVARPAAVDLCPRLLPQPARGQAGPVRPGLTMDPPPSPDSRRRPGGARAARGRGRPRGRAAHRRRASRRPRRRQDQEHRHRRRHGHGPARPGPAALAAARGPARRTASSARRRAARPAARRSPGSSTPSTAPSTTSTASPRMPCPWPPSSATRPRPGAWRPVAGAVVNPVTRRALPRPARRRARGCASATGPATRLAIGEPPELGQALVGTGFGYDAGTPALAGPGAAARCCRRSATSAASAVPPWTSARVAAGTLDGYFERGLNPWDMAAAWLVLTEAGGSVHRSRAAGPPSRPWWWRRRRLHADPRRWCCRAAERRRRGHWPRTGRDRRR